MFWTLCSLTRRTDSVGQPDAEQRNLMIGNRGSANAQPRAAPSPSVSQEAESLDDSGKC